jgi:ABC-type multidrug transport system fused ATPase/permease subunit
MSLVWDSLLHLRGQRWAIFAIGIASVVVAQAEAVVLLVIAGTAGALAAGEESLALDTAGVAIDLPISSALQAGAAAVIVAAALEVMLVRVRSRIVAEIERERRDELMDRYARADWSYQAAQREGNLLTATKLTDAAGRLFAGLTAWVKASLSILVLLAAAFLVDPRAASVVMAIAALLAIVVVPLRRRTRRSAREYNRLSVAYGQDIAELGRRAMDLRVFGAWPSALTSLSQSSLEVANQRRTNMRLFSGVPIVYQYGGIASILGVLLLATSTVTPVGSWAAIALLLLRSIQYGQRVQTAILTLTEYLPRLDLLNQHFQPPPPSVTFGHRQLVHLDRIVLDDVSYAYPAADTPALHHVSGAIERGELVGLAGPSGSGKSTLGQIVLRLREPTSGTLLVNGRPAQEYDRESWVARVTYVPQQPLLFRGTLFDNIALHRTTVTPDDARRAAREAGLESLLHELGSGLDALVGPGHRDLSGGQTQRVGIARALVSAPDLVVLDEPTSALDAASESIIHDSIQRLRQHHGLTVLLIAHNDSTLALCDRVLQMREGRLLSSTEATPA